MGWQRVGQDKEQQNSRMVRWLRSDTRVMGAPEREEKEKGTKDILEKKH